MISPSGFNDKNYFVQIISSVTGNICAVYKLLDTIDRGNIIEYTVTEPYEEVKVTKLYADIEKGYVKATTVFEDGKELSYFFKDVSVDIAFGSLEEKPND